MNITSKLLKDLRLKKNITLDQLAAEIHEKFDISITSSMLSKWETGKAAPVYDHLKRLALYYNVTTDFLLGFDQYENLTMIDSEDNSESNNIHRFSKRHKRLDNIAQLLKDEIFTHKDLVFIEDFITLYRSRKDKNPYR